MPFMRWELKKDFRKMEQARFSGCREGDSRAKKYFVRLHGFEWYVNDLADCAMAMTRVQVEMDERKI